jgi:hypothetical protein
MDFVEKARLRMERWLSHNDHHDEEYSSFADQLNAAGQTKSAEFIREMMQFSTKSNQFLQKALESLQDP